MFDSQNEKISAFINVNLTTMELKLKNGKDLYFKFGYEIVEAKDGLR